MCDPVSLTIAATVVAVAGTAYTAISTNNAKKYEAKVADQNAKLADNASADALERGRIDAKNQARRLAALKGDQSAAMAANGLDLSFGSPLDIASDTATLGSEDALTVRENARRESLGYSINSANYTAQGVAARAAGKAALISGAISATGSILGGASQVGKMNASSSSGGGYSGSLGY